MGSFARLILTMLLATLPQVAAAQDGESWVVSWVAAAQGPYPSGNASAQPDQRFAFPAPSAGANNQTRRRAADLAGRIHFAAGRRDRRAPIQAPPAPEMRLSTSCMDP